MKKMIVVTGSDLEFQDRLVSEMAITGAVTKTLSANAKTEAVVREIFPAPKFPVEIAPTDVRRFFTKLEKGVHAINFYVGIKIPDHAALVAFFRNNVGGKAFGPDWVVKDLADEYRKLSGGVYLVAGLDLDEAVTMKSTFPQDVGLVQVVSGDEKKHPRADVRVKAKEESDKEALKVLNRLKQQWKGTSSDDEERITER